MEVLVQWFSDNHVSQHIFKGDGHVYHFHDPDSGASRRSSGGITSESISAAKAIPICIVGNIIPIPFILLFIRQIFKLMKKTKTVQRTDRKNGKQSAMGKSDQIKRYEFLGLLLFVGIPLPGTGAWTGSLIASLLEVDIKKSSIAILCGLIMASAIMYIVSYGIVGNVVH